MEVTINYNGQAVTVEVTLEVYEFLDRADHKTENLFHEQRRHWDGREFDEYIITTEGVGGYGETPEEYLCRMETLHELMAVLDTCTEAQRRRFLLYALDGLSLAEIGVLCGCSKVAVYQSVEAVSYTHLDVYKRQDWYSAEIQKTPEDLRNALLGTYANFLEDKITGNDRDLTVTETGEIQQRCRELLEKCREP